MLPEKEVQQESQTEIRNEIQKEIRALITERFYPCVAAVQSVAKGDYDLGTYVNFGSGADREKLRASLIEFISKWKETRSTTYSLWAVFPEAQIESEEEFETLLWSELSSLTSHEERDSDWAEGWSQNPEDRNFTVCVGGHALFAVGVHPESSRKARRFPYPAIVFNIFDQFKDLQVQGSYASMVQKNRERDLRYQGSVNPMAEEYGEVWEPIQFSGKENPPTWGCPFHFKHKSELGK